MALLDDLKAEVRSVFTNQWQTVSGRVVPEPSDVGLGNRAVEFDPATVLYADLDQSTAMVDSQDWYFSAEVYKTFLHCAAKIIKAQDGVITAYDGDRIMALFIGDHKNTNAAICGLKINGAVRNVIRPALALQYPSSGFVVNHTVGIDTSSIRAARTGVRGDNDLVWVGRAANHAAKLTALASDTPTWITGDVYDKLADSAKQYNGQNVWKEWKWPLMNNLRIYSSSWFWAI